MIDVKDNVTRNMFTPQAGRPRKFKDNAEKMRAYRREKRIKELMAIKKCSREKAEELVNRGYRKNCYYSGYY